MDELTWYTRSADKQTATVPEMLVMFSAKTYGSGGTRSRVYIGVWRPGDPLPDDLSSDHTLVAQIHSIGDMERAKDNCLRAFENWASDVSRIVKGG